jgi:hypothetical protein
MLFFLSLRVKDADTPAYDGASTVGTSHSSTVLTTCACRFTEIYTINYGCGNQLRTRLQRLAAQYRVIKKTDLHANSRNDIRKVGVYD